MLAQYPKRLTSNRTNAYALPGDSNNIKDGLLSFETRQCTGQSVQTPSIAPAVTGILDETLRDQIIKFALNNGNVVAPPCKQQPRFNLAGNLTQFPQLTPNINGTQAGAPQP
jgi:hypothetical protein